MGRGQTTEQRKSNFSTKKEDASSGQKEKRTKKEVMKVFFFLPSLKGKTKDKDLTFGRKEAGRLLSKKKI